MWIMGIYCIVINVVCLITYDSTATLTNSLHSISVVLLFNYTNEESISHEIT